MMMAKIRKERRVEDFSLIDLIPGPLYRFGYWLKTRPQEIKWWIQRANGKLPECDMWSFNATMIRELKQGLDYLLREDGVRDWTYSREERKEYKDLKFAREWLADAEYFMVEHCALIAGEGDYDDRLGFEKGKKCYFVESDRWRIYVTPEWWDDFEKRKDKTFRILGKYLWGLWD